MFLKDQGVIERIKQESGNNIFDIIDCYVKFEGLYKVHTFVIVVQNQKELEKVWKDISGDIALHFQGELEVEIEIWNIYLLFLVQGNVDSQIRYLIEQNKYSSRKLVIEDIKSPISEGEIKTIINEKLFAVRVNPIPRDDIDTVAEPISKTLETNYRKLFTIINHSDEKPAVLLTKYLELLKDES